MIEAYSFGIMKIDGETYTTDLIVFPELVKSDWWRSEGHKLHVEDLEEVLKMKPDVLVVGTGYYGLMKVLPETKKRLQSEGVFLISEKTNKASKIFNESVKSRKTIGAFHLTC